MGILHPDIGPFLNLQSLQLHSTLTRLHIASYLPFVLHLCIHVHYSHSQSRHTSAFICDLAVWQSTSPLLQHSGAASCPHDGSGSGRMKVAVSEAALSTSSPAERSQRTSALCRRASIERGQAASAERVVSQTCCRTSRAG